MDDSIEYVAIIGCLDALIAALRLNPLATSEELANAGIIALLSDDEANDVDSVAQRVCLSIRGNPEKFQSLLDIMSQSDWFREVGVSISSQYGKPSL